MKRKFPPHFPGFLRFHVCSEASQEANVCGQPRLKHRVTEGTEFDVKVSVSSVTLCFISSLGSATGIAPTRLSGMMLVRT